MGNIIERARLKYKPERIKYLLVAESPPKLGTRRFFYFEKVDKQDSLFVETMKVLYPENIADIPALRANKGKFLKRFQDDGFYLIDALDMPIQVTGTKKKTKKIEGVLPSLEHKIKEVAQPDTKIILISRPVYDAAYSYLVTRGYNIVNEEMIDFPGSGWQPAYREKMKYLLDKHQSL